MKYLIRYSISGSVVIEAGDPNKAKELVSEIPIETLLQHSKQNTNESYSIGIGTVEEYRAKKTLLHQLLEAGMQRDQIDNWQSDLYVLKNDISESVLDKYEHKDIVTTFVSQLDNKLWYDIPFAFEEFHRKEAKR